MLSNTHCILESKSWGVMISMSKVEDMLQEILHNQKKLLNDLLQQRQTIQSLEERLDKIERARTSLLRERKIPPSLIRVLKALAEAEKPMSAENAASKVNLSRNLTSGYLNKLADLGYAVKEPNLEGKGARYLFKVNYSAVPEYIKQILKKYER